MIPESAKGKRNTLSKNIQLKYSIKLVGDRQCATIENVEQYLSPVIRTNPLFLCSRLDRLRVGLAHGNGFM